MGPQPQTAATVSVIVPARNEEACLGECLRSLVGQAGIRCDIIVVDDHSSDHTHALAESFAARTAGGPEVRVITADPLPAGWCGKCNAAWSGAKAAQGNWLLFTDADTRHSPNSIATGLAEAQQYGADLLSYSPRQEVRGLAERVLMPLIFAELAVTYRPQHVSDPQSPDAAANGQYLLIRRAVYDAVGGHAAVAGSLLEDVELARVVKRSGYRLRFRRSEVVSTRMYRSFPRMWEGWTKNLALLFPNARGLALRRSLEFALVLAGSIGGLGALAMGNWIGLAWNAALCGSVLFFVYARVARAHFDWLSGALAPLGLPLFALLLLNSYICHKRGVVKWKGREYGSGEEVLSP